MTSNGEGKEFVKWLKEWRSEIRSHLPLGSIHGEKREDENESVPDNDSIARRNGVIPKPTIVIKR
jgi:hypothetical protein